MSGDGKELDLEEAYAVETPDDNRDLYGRWASTYESGFATRHAYVYHERVATTFAGAAGPDDDPVLDIGCGTGLVGEALRALGGWTIDGLDLSPEMLDEARRKTAGDGSPVYHDLHVADLTAPLGHDDDTWGAIVSAGTFTHGHVGPDAFDELYRIARTGALFVVGINPDHFEGQGYAGRFAADADAGRITAPDYHHVPTYSLGDHVDRLSVLAVFRTT
ncbi:MAG: methyltransferase domain-containing protein [Acidimicrobiales bacterium]|nr:methyltransferase domain-containing protein [Acidimicrobiales bacterium]